MTSSDVRIAYVSLMKRIAQMRQLFAAERHRYFAGIIRAPHHLPNANVRHMYRSSAQMGCVRCVNADAQPMSQIAQWRHLWRAGIVPVLNRFKSVHVQHLFRFVAKVVGNVL